jgi:hypothetical protein
MTGEKQQPKPRIGDACWFVEWCIELAFCGGNQEYGVDCDACKMACRRVGTKEEAERLAREVYPVTTKTFGVVGYWPAEFVPYDDDDAVRYPHVGRWNATADPEYYEGEG